mmetsp:Transcript_45110/g.54214  ORF Transcript_45110/g.54214 Transcript_45110/m.54214 type:complete len:116 (+) Transcript_45110:71-418(+)
MEISLLLFLNMDKSNKLSKAFKVLQQRASVWNGDPQTDKISPNCHKETPVNTGLGSGTKTESKDLVQEDPHPTVASCPPNPDDEDKIVLTNTGILTLFQSFLRPRQLLPRRIPTR